MFAEAATLQPSSLFLIKRSPKRQANVAALFSQIEAALHECALSADAFAPKGEAAANAVQRSASHDRITFKTYFTPADTQSVKWSMQVTPRYNTAPCPTLHWSWMQPPVKAAASEDETQKAVCSVISVKLQDEEAAAAAETSIFSTVNQRFKQAFRLRHTSTAVFKEFWWRQPQGTCRIAAALVAAASEAKAILVHFVDDAAKSAHAAASSAFPAHNAHFGELFGALLGDDFQAVLLYGGLHSVFAEATKANGEDAAGFGTTAELLRTIAQHHVI